MDINNCGIPQPYDLNPGTADRAADNINRMESFSSYCFGAGAGAGRGIGQSSPMDIPGQSQLLRHALVHGRQSSLNVPTAGRFTAKNQEEGKQIASLLKTTHKVRDGIFSTTDHRRFLVQYRGAIFNFCLDENGAISTSAMVHPTSVLPEYFARVAGQPPMVFQKMEGARQILIAYLAEKNDAPRSVSAPPHGRGSSFQDDFVPFGSPSFP